MSHVFGRHDCRIWYSPAARQVNESWSMDFLAGQLLTGQHFRILTLADNFTRESLAIRSGQRLGTASPRQPANQRFLLLP